VEKKERKARMRMRERMGELRKWNREKDSSKRKRESVCERKRGERERGEIPYDKERECV